MRVRFKARIFWVMALCFVLLTLLAFGASAQEGRKLLTQSTPDYPATAKPIRLSGTVKVQVVIGTDGQIKETRVLGGHPLFVDATLTALKRWKYAPAPAETTAQLEFNFHP